MEAGKIFITLLRHGESEGNVRHLFQGQEDYPLSELGRRQADALGRYFVVRQKTFGTVFSSPLSRALETAEIVAGHLGLVVEQISDLVEQDFGDWNHLSYKDPEFISSRPSFFSPYEKPGNRGESKFDLLSRAAGLVPRLAQQKAGRYLVVSHESFINSLLYVMLGIFPKPSLEGPRFRHENTGYTELIYEPAVHRWRMLSMNRRAHLNGID